MGRLIYETYPSPLKLEHKDHQISEFSEAEYVAQPRLMREVTRPGGDGDCRERTLDRWNRLPSVQDKKRRLKDQLTVVEPYRPETEELVVVGKAITQEMLSDGSGEKNEIPTIAVEEASVSGLGSSYIPIRYTSADPLM